MLEIPECQKSLRAEFRSCAQREPDFFARQVASSPKHERTRPRAKSKGRSRPGRVTGMANDREKEAAARASLKFVREGDIVGLGTGSTAAYAVRFLGERVQAGLKIRGIPTSIHTQELAASLGIPLTTLDEVSGDRCHHRRRGRSRSCTCG